MDLITQSEGFTGSYLVEEAIPVSYAKTWKDGDPTPGVCLLTLFHKKPGLEEAIPVSYAKTWKDGEPTPGVCLLTLFHKKPGLDQETFINRWHHSHTPLSLRLHPLWNYNRNVVSSAISEGSSWYDGIVEEQFQKPSDLLNPLVFFGPPLKVLLHMYEVLKDTRSFIDMRKIETYLTTEIHFKSPPKP